MQCSYCSSYPPQGSVKYPEPEPEKRNEISLLRYLLQFPKGTRNDIARDLVEQGRVFTELTDMGLIGFVLLQEGE
jgi:hypothetical protein